VDIGGGSALISRLEARFGRQHSLVQYANDANSSGYNAVKHNVLSMLKLAKAGADGVARSPDPRALREHSKNKPVCLRHIERTAPIPTGSL
jgi:hypothetical protein